MLLTCGFAFVPGTSTGSPSVEDGDSDGDDDSVGSSSAGFRPVLFTAPMLAASQLVLFRFIPSVLEIGTSSPVKPGERMIFSFSVRRKKKRKNHFRWIVRSPIAFVDFSLVDLIFISRYF
jgi:hypothetical protein